MDGIMMDIAAMGMSMKAQEMQVNFSTAATKRVLEDQEAAAAQLLQMLPQIPKGQYVDVYA